MRCVRKIVALWCAVSVLFVAVHLSAALDRSFLRLLSMHKLVSHCHAQVFYNDYCKRFGVPAYDPFCKMHNNQPWPMKIDQLHDSYIDFLWHWHESVAFGEAKEKQDQRTYLMLLRGAIHNRHDLLENCDGSSAQCPFDCEHKE